MKLTPQEVKRQYEKGTLKIALLGMSNIGKSHFAKRLNRDFGLTPIEVDTFIQHKLGKSSMNDHAAWLGQPYSDGYTARENEVMQLESEATQDAMQQCLGSGNMVLDTPGSVIYTEQKILEQLTEQFWIIYIEADNSDVERLKELYYSSPKPLIWKDSYNPKLASTPDEAVMASYPNLLANRAEIYSQLADLTLPAQPLFEGKIDLAIALGLS